MNNESNYTSIIVAKNGTEIPAFSDGRTVDSKYNPEREAENLISAKISAKIENKENYKASLNKSYFFIVIGIGSGTLIEKLSEKFSQSKIIAIESSYENIRFLEKLEKIKKLKNNKNIILSDIESIEEKLINNYLPALYNKLEIIEQRGWIEKNKDKLEILNKKINKAIGIISADFSVQTHFGKIWQSNIINNLKTLKFSENKTFSELDLKKTAAIIAAGPSLDNNINKIIKNREKYFIIATDTSFSVLLKYGIIPEIVISIDGQHISHNHFLNIKDCKKTLFLLDLCSDYSIGHFLSNNKCNVLYFISGHPLAILANSLSNNKFPYLFSGAGTVTITAMDLALKLGFSNIELFGADFSYSKGKAYTKGTYFDTIFNINNSKINTTESQYSKLMFRTELIKLENNEYSTEILSAYRMSLEQYLADNKCIFSKEDNIYKIKSSNSGRGGQKTINLKRFSYNFDKFITYIKDTNLLELKYPLLPYVAWLKNKENNESLKFIALLKLAQSNIVRYN